MLGSKSFVGRRRAAVALVTIVTLVSCGSAERGAFVRTGPITSVGTALSQSTVRRAASTPIQHVIFIVQENRSFDNLFQGYPGADTASVGLDSLGNTIPLTPISLAAPYDIDHSSYAFFPACDGSPPGRNCKMDGFDLEYNTAAPSQYPHPQYGYVPASESALYFAMAKQYVLGDRMFTSHIDASYISHQYAVAAQANGAVDFPTGQWGCSGPSDTIGTLNSQRGYGPSIPVCQDYQSVGDELDAKGLTWRYYAAGKNSGWNGYASIKHIRYGPDWKHNMYGRPSHIILDIKSGNLANVSWVTPTCANSDHSGCGSTHGPQWIATIVNALGKSKYWNSSALFVMWDEWGGWYDHVPPPYVDFDGLGMRVPLLVISAYAKKGYVSHVQYEHGSVLRFIEDTFGLGQLAASDARANSPAVDCFNFSLPPRPFSPFHPTLTEADFIRSEPAELKITPDAE
jgi:phospholipase C